MFCCDTPSKVIQTLWCNIINSQNIFNRWANENESNTIASIPLHSAYVLATKKCSFILHPSRIKKVILFIQKCYRSSLSKKKVKKREREKVRRLMMYSVVLTMLRWSLWDNTTLDEWWYCFVHKTFEWWCLQSVISDFYFYFLEEFHRNKFNCFQGKQYLAKRTECQRSINTFLKDILLNAILIDFYHLCF